MTVQITPLHDRVLVRRPEEKETAKGGIIIPDTARIRSLRCTDVRWARLQVADEVHGGIGENF
jgi:co-chaperonin GroES (HSP10)